MAFRPLLVVVMATALGCGRTGLVGYAAGTPSDAAAADGTSTIPEAVDAAVTPDAGSEGTEVDSDPFYWLDDAGCLEVDVSTFDKSCESPSDCALVPNRFCPGLACPHAVINRDGLARFDQVFSHLPPNPRHLDAGCAEYGTLQPGCLQGFCAYSQSFGP
jgi:hypothetical protein